MSVVGWLSLHGMLDVFVRRCAAVSDSAVVCGGGVCVVETGSWYSAVCGVDECLRASWRVCEFAAV